jgi:hypothetical protein
MASISVTRLQTIDSEDLTPIVRHALESPYARVLNWQSVPLTGGLGHTVTSGIGIYRFFGTAQIEDQVLPWSVVIKTRSSASKQVIHDPTSLHYWKRELLIYQCRLFDDVGVGFALPRCYGTVEHEDGEQWLWLEYIEESKEIWPLERFGLAARHLGQFNAASLLHNWPVYPWFSSGFMREWPASQASVLQDLHRWIKQPHSWLTLSAADRILCLYQERDRFQ